ncbi:MAG: antiterminator LoaP [Caldisericia bacterium]|nr:antiterminator LoaP [Caldisericia bacterium]
MSDFLIDSSSPWFCIFVQTGHEERVRIRLKRNLEIQLNMIIPQRQVRQRVLGKWNEIRKPIFPGYILVNNSMDGTECYRINRTEKVVKVLTDQEGFPKPILESELAPILNLIRDGEIILPSKVIAAGNSIQVISGPLLNMEGYVKKVNLRKGRAQIVLDFMGKEKKIDLGIEVLKII